MAARDDGATTNEAPRADEEAGCGAATGVIEGGGVGATAACDAAAAEGDSAPAGCSTGWRRAMAGWP